MARTPDELRRLTTPEFNQLLAADPELKRLAALRFDAALDVSVLLEILELGDWRIGNLPIRPLTVAKLAFLWALGNPLVVGGDLTEAAADVALYILSVPGLGEIPCGLAGIPGEAAGYAKATGLDLAAVDRELRRVKRAAFRPLEMLPVTAEDHDGEPPRYDGVWSAAIAGVAARESGHDLQYCLHRMPLSAVCACFVNNRRREGTDGDQIRYRPNPEVLNLIDARVEILADQFLTEQNKPN